MGKLTDAIVASGKTISDEARSLLENFETVVAGIVDSEKKEMATLYEGVKNLVEANAKELGEHKDTLLKVAKKVDSQVERTLKGITSKEEWREGIRAKAEEFKSLYDKSQGEMKFTIKGAATDPIIHPNNYPTGLPIPVLAPGIGSTPWLESSYFDYVDKVTYPREGAKPVTVVDRTPFEGNAEWWGKLKPDGTYMSKSEVSFGYTAKTVIPKTVAVRETFWKYDLLDLDFLENELYNTLTRMITREIRRAILLGDSTANALAPDGVWSQAVAYNLATASGTVKVANVADAISKMACQIRMAGYEGQIVASVAPGVMCEMNTLKAENGTYLDVSKPLAGIVVREDMALTGNQVLVSIPERFHVRLFGGIDVEFIVGSVKDADDNVIGTTPEFNMLKIRAEQRLLTYMFTWDKPSAVKADDVNTVVDDINQQDA